MNKLEALRLSENYDEDGVLEEEMLEHYENSKRKTYREEYKEFYSDIKLDVKEDW